MASNKDIESTIKGKIEKAFGADLVVFRELRHRQVKGQTTVVLVIDDKSFERPVRKRTPKMADDASA